MSQPHEWASAHERRTLLAKILHYQTLLHEHGIDVDDVGAERFFDANRRMVEAAAEFMDAAAELRAAYGTSVELLNARNWR